MIGYSLLLGSHPGILGNHSYLESSECVWENLAGRLPASLLTTIYLGMHDMLLLMMRFLLTDVGLLDFDDQWRVLWQLSPVLTVLQGFDSH